MLLDNNDIIRTSQLNGTDNEDVIYSGSHNNYWVHGLDGDDLLIGSQQADVLNAGRGNGTILTGDGADRIYVDDHNGGDELFMDFRDTDFAVDRLFLGQDKNAIGDTLGTTFIDIQGWGQEDELVLRDFGAEDVYYTIPTNAGLIMKVASGGDLHMIRFDGFFGDVNVVFAQNH